MGAYTKRLIAIERVWEDSVGHCTICGGRVGGDVTGCDVPAGRRCLAAARAQMATQGVERVEAVDGLGRFLRGLA